MKFYNLETFEMALNHSKCALKNEFDYKMKTLFGTNIDKFKKNLLKEKQDNTDA